MSLEEDAGYALSKEGTDPLTISAPEEMLTGDPLSRLLRFGPKMSRNTHALTPSS